MAENNRNKPMCKAFQRYNIPRILHKFYPNFYDSFNDFLDSSLTLPENLENISRILDGRDIVDEIKGEILHGF